MGVAKGVPCSVVPPTSCSDLIGASATQTGFGHNMKGGPPIKSSGDDPAYSSCSDLIGAYTTQIGFGHNTKEVLRSSRRTTGTKFVMLLPDRSIHYANRLWTQHKGGPPIKSEGDEWGEDGGRRLARGGGRRRILPSLFPRPKAVSTPRSVLPRLKPCRLFPVLRTFPYAGTWHLFPFPPLHAVPSWFPLSLVPSPKTPPDCRFPAVLVKYPHEPQIRGRRFRP